MSSQEDKRIAELTDLISNFTKTNPDVQGNIVMAYPAGIPLVDSLESEVDPIMIGAVSAAVRLTFQHLCDNLKLGKLKRLFMNSEKGRIIIENAGSNAILTSIVEKFANLYGEAFKTHDLALKIEKILKGYKFE